MSGGESDFGKIFGGAYKELGLPMDEFWFNIAGPGESTGWHDHKERSELSGVYYLHVPDNSGDIHFRKKLMMKLLNGK